MYILYIDESGTINSNKPFILGFMIVSIEQSKSLESSLNDMVISLRHNNPHDIEIHGHHIKTGKGIWRNKTKAERQFFFDECIKTQIQQPSAAGGAITPI